MKIQKEGGGGRGEDCGQSYRIAKPDGHSQRNFWNIQQKTSKFFSLVFFVLNFFGFQSMKNDSFHDIHNEKWFI